MKSKHTFVINSGAFNR